MGQYLYSEQNMGFSLMFSHVEVEISNPLPFCE
jgi:hypothetical protein